jgi:hypothetical protein
LILIITGKEDVKTPKTPTTDERKKRKSRGKDKT